jgi:AraC-like DNA-binding protein
LYEGQDVDETKHVLCRLFTETAIEPLNPRSPYSARVNGLALPQSTLCYCEYRHGMGAVPRRPLDFHAIQLIRSGNTRFDIDNQSVVGDTRRGVMLSADQQLKVQHSPGSGVLSFIVKDTVVGDIMSSWTGHAEMPPIRFLTPFDTSDPTTASVLLLLQHMVTEIDRPGSLLEVPAAVASFEHALINFMLFGMNHNLSESLRATPNYAGAEQVKRVEEYIEANAPNPIDMNTLARITGHSASAIFRAFRKHRDYTPMQFLLNVRMRLVRQHLVQATPTSSVTAIAMKSGFFHLGRFAAEYRLRFGESPSQTLKRAKASA